MKRLTLIFSITLSISISAQTNYYSQSNGDPAVLSNWNTIRTGGGTSPLNFTTNDQHYLIQNGHTMTTTSTWSISGGSGVKLQIENGGILQADYAVDLTTTGTFQIDGGGTYIHNNTGAANSTIFDGTESFAATSSVEIRNWSVVGSSLTTGVTLPFGNLTINWSSNSGDWQWSLSGSVNLCAGNFALTSTGSGTLRLGASGGPAITILGNLSISAGTLNFSNGSGATTINLSGNIDMSGGTITETSSGSGTINFAGSGTQTFTKSGGTISNTINFAVNSGTTLSMGTNVLDGSGGTFTLNSGGTLQIGSTVGITSSGATGNIQVTGTRTFSSSANYTYNGSSAQVTGNAFTSANNLTINNSSGVSLSTNAQVTGTLTLTSGLFILGSSSLSLGNSASISGSPSSSKMIVATGSGYLSKGFSGTGSFTFPVGDNTGTAEYSPATLNFTSGTFSSAIASVNLTNSKHSSNTSSTNYLTRYWTVASSGISSFSSDVTFTYVDADINGTESNIYLGKYSSGTWTLLNVATTGTNQLTGTVSSFSDFTGGESSALPVELTSFTSNVVGNKVELSWRTATEVNNYGFEVERGQTSNVKSETWEKIGFVQGNGNSNSPKNYSFTDQPTGGKEFKYRLKQIDFDGSFEYSYEITAKLGNVSTYKLDQNYPNPFNPYTKISYTIPQRAYIRLRVYDMLAKEVAELINTNQEAGRYEVTFDGSNLPSGAYFYKLEAGNYIEVKKLLRVK